MDGWASSGDFSAISQAVGAALELATARCREAGGRRAQRPAAPACNVLLGDACLIEHEGELLGCLEITVEAPGLAAVAGCHVDAEHQRIGIRLELAQPRHPL